VIADKTVSRVGKGLTCNVSKTGVLFESDAYLHEGNSVEVLIDWPVPFHGEEPMQLLMCGTVIRFEENRVAVKVVHYDFIPSDVVRTMSAPLLSRGGRRRVLYR
jgi:hypothetical protein